jgi:hypothetical protein
MTKEEWRQRRIPPVGGPGLWLLRWLQETPETVCHRGFRDSHGKCPWPAKGVRDSSRIATSTAWNTLHVSTLILFHEKGGTHHVETG